MKKNKFVNILNNNSNINYGIRLLKTLMCFVVVCCHFYTNISGYKFLSIVNIYEPYAVFIFMFISAYYSCKIFDNPFVKLKNKLLTLFLTQMVWAIIYFVCYSILKYDISIKSLIFQIFTGHSENLNPTMWYQIVLIWLIFIFYIISKIFKSDKKYFIWFIILLFSLYFQYSNLNYNLFNNLIYEIRYPLGRFFEMIPVFVLGLFIYKSNIMIKLKRHYLFIILISILSLYVFLNYNIFYAPNGFGYSGINGVIIAFFTFTLFYVIPFEKVPNILKNIIYVFTMYSAGIYFCHRLSERFISIINKNIIVNSFKYCVVIYIVSFAICFLISLIPSKLSKKLI